MFLLLFGEFSRSVLVQTNFYSQFHVGYFFEARKSYYIAWILDIYRPQTRFGAR